MELSCRSLIGARSFIAQFSRLTGLNRTQHLSHAPSFGKEPRFFPERSPSWVRMLAVMPDPRTNEGNQDSQYLHSEGLAPDPQPIEASNGPCICFYVRPYLLAHLLL